MQPQNEIREARNVNYIQNHISLSKLFRPEFYMFVAHLFKLPIFLEIQAYAHLYLSAGVVVRRIHINVIAD